MAKTKAELEADNARLLEENTRLAQAAVAINSGEDKTAAELRQENARLTEENAKLRDTQTDKSVDAAIDSVSAGTCPNCGFNVAEHRELIKNAIPA